MIIVNSEVFPLFRVIHHLLMASSNVVDLSSDSFKNLLVFLRELLVLDHLFFDLGEQLIELLLIRVDCLEDFSNLLRLIHKTYQDIHLLAEYDFTYNQY